MIDDYSKLVEFWNSSFEMSVDEKNQVLNQINPDEDYYDLAPSKKLYDILKLFNGKEKILDYGCGSGWASIIIAKNGVKDITAVDVSKNSVEMLECYAKAFKVDAFIRGISIDSEWLRSLPKGAFDGFFSSNVIDVIPLDMAEEIIMESARITTDDAVAIFSLNYYIDPAKMADKGFTVNGPYVYIDNVLRLTALKDEEWSDIFKKYYQIESLSYFAWPKEEKETRRLFVLKKK